MLSPPWLQTSHLSHLPSQTNPTPAPTPAPKQFAQTREQTFPSIRPFAHGCRNLHLCIRCMRASELSHRPGYSAVWYFQRCNALRGKAVKSYDITRFLVLPPTLECVCTVRLGRGGRIPVVILHVPRYILLRFAER